MTDHIEVVGITERLEAELAQAKSDLEIIRETNAEIGDAVRDMQERGAALEAELAQAKHRADEMGRKAKKWRKMYDASVVRERKAREERDHEFDKNIARTARIRDLEAELRKMNEI